MQGHSGFPLLLHFLLTVLLLDPQKLVVRDFKQYVCLQMLEIGAGGGGTGGFPTMQWEGDNSKTSHKCAAAVQGFAVKSTEDWGKPLYSPQPTLMSSQGLTCFQVLKVTKSIVILFLIFSSRASCISFACRIPIPCTVPESV